MSEGTNQCLNHAGHEARLMASEVAMTEMHTNIREVVRGQHELRERIAAVESKASSAHKRLDSQEQQTKAIVSMGSAIEHVAKQMEEAIHILKDHDSRLDDLERIPNEIYVEQIKNLTTEVKALKEEVGNLKHAPGDLMVSWVKIAVGSMITGGVGLLIGMWL